MLWIGSATLAVIGIGIEDGWLPALLVYFLVVLTPTMSLTPFCKIRRRGPMSGIANRILDFFAAPIECYARPVWVAIRQESTARERLASEKIREECADNWKGFTLEK